MKKLLHKHLLDLHSFSDGGFATPLYRFIIPR